MADAMSRKGRSVSTAAQTAEPKTGARPVPAKATVTHDPVPTGEESETEEPMNHSMIQVPRANVAVMVTQKHREIARSIFDPKGMMTDPEFDLFFYECDRRGVHPLDRLIIPVKYGGKMTFIVAVDYLRARAARSGVHLGTADPDMRYVMKDGKPKLSQPTVATVTVKKLVRGYICEFTASARWDEYCPEGTNRMWDKMPCTMLGKCAEALALRKAFPAELSGLYSKEEMGQAGYVDIDGEVVTTEAKGKALPPAVEDAPDQVDEEKPAEKPATKGKKKATPGDVFDWADAHQWKRTELYAFIRAKFGEKKTVKDLSAEECATAIGLLVAATDPDEDDGPADGETPETQFAGGAGDGPEPDDPFGDL